MSFINPFFSTKGGTRTLTLLPALDFESSVSTNSTTLASGYKSIYFLEIAKYVPFIFIAFSDSSTFLYLSINSRV